MGRRGFGITGFRGTLIELKWKKSAEGTVAQIKERNYASWFKDYTGKILLVRINYDERKGHECVIERYTNEQNIQSIHQ